jgi:1,2-diacylglycerol 3-alpha-glucosyltransferase
MSSIAQKPPTIAIHWPRFGHYHLARLNAAFHRLQLEGIQVVGIETASRDETYEWHEERGSTDFERHVIFPGRSFETITCVEMWHRIYDFLDVIEPNIIAVNGYSSPDSLALLLWCCVHQRQAILMSESKEDDAPRLRLKEWLKRRVIHRFSAALCGGTSHRNYLEQLGMDPEKIFLGYDAVDNRYFRQEATRARQNFGKHRHLPGLEDSTPFFLASARFIKRKNLGTLLIAYQQYRAEVKRMGYGPWRLVILGDGEERSNYVRLIRGNELEGVTLAGFRQIEELPAYYGLAKVFIHPAVQEQWGLVVNEAMASGLPVLVSGRCGCVPDLICNGENGFIFDPDNTAELAELMQRTSSGQVDLAAMGRAARAHISHWGPERFAEGLYGALQVALGKANP